MRFRKKQITESPDAGTGYSQTFNSSDEDAVPFIVYNGEIVVSNRTAVSHAVFDDLDRPEELGYTKYSTTPGLFEKSGRVWLDKKVLSTWWRPSKKELKKLIPKIENRVAIKHKKININDLWTLHLPEGDDGVTSKYKNYSLEDYDIETSQSYEKYQDIKRRHADPDQGVGGVDKNTYKIKKMKGKKKDRFPGGSEPRDLGVRGGEDSEYSSKITKFREVVREIIKEII